MAIHPSKPTTANPSHPTSRSSILAASPVNAFGGGGLPPPVTLPLLALLPFPGERGAPLVVFPIPTVGLQSKSPSADMAIQAEFLATSTVPNGFLRAKTHSRDRMHYMCLIHMRLDS